MIYEIDNIILLGTSHVSKQSQQEIKGALAHYKPEVVGIELDFGRLKTLLSKKTKKTSSYKTIKAIGITGYLFASLASFVQSKVGKSLNIDPGVDMKTAYLEAKKENIITALIDQPIQITLKKFSELSLKKKISLFSNLFIKSLKKENREKLQFDVKKGVPGEQQIETMLEIVKKEVPDFYDILIHQRNVYMVHKLLELQKNHQGKILAVVGAGHLKGMKELLEQHSTSSVPSLENSINVSFAL